MIHKMLKSLEVLGTAGVIGGFLTLIGLFVFTVVGHHEYVLVDSRLYREFMLCTKIAVFGGILGGFLTAVFAELIDEAFFDPRVIRPAPKLQNDHAA